MAKTNLLITTLLILTLLTTTTNATLLSEQVPAPTYESRSSFFDSLVVGACTSITSASAQLAPSGISPNDPVYSRVNNNLVEATNSLSEATLTNPEIERKLIELAGPVFLIQAGFLFDLVGAPIDIFKGEKPKALTKSLTIQYLNCKKNALIGMDYTLKAFNELATETDTQASLLNDKLGDHENEYTSEFNVLTEYKLATNKEGEVSAALSKLNDNFEAVFDYTRFGPDNANKIVFAIQSAARKSDDSQLAVLAKLYSNLKAANGRLDDLDTQAKNDLNEKMTAYDTLVETTSEIKVRNIFEVRELLSSSNYQVELSNADGKGWNQKTTIAKSKHTEAEHLKELADDVESEKAPGYLVEALEYRKAAIEAANVSVSNLEAIVLESQLIDDALTAKYTNDHNEARDLLATSGDFANKYNLMNALDVDNSETDGTYYARIESLIKGIKTSQKVIALLGSGASKAKAVNAILKDVNDGIKLAENLNKAGVVVTVEKQDLENIKTQLEKGEYTATSLDVSSRIESMLISAREKYSDLDDYYAQALELRDAGLLAQSDLVTLNRNAEYFNQDSQLDIKAAAAKLATIEKELSEIVNRNNAKWEKDSSNYAAKNLKIYAQPTSLRIGEASKINARISLSPPMPLAASVEIPIEQISLFANSNVNDLQVINAQGVTLSEDALTFAQGLDYYTLEFSYTGALSSFSSFTKTAVMKNEDYTDVQIAASVKSRVKYDALWPVAFESSAKNIVVNGGVWKYASAPSELKVSLLAKENKFKLNYLVENPIDWQISETPSGKHYKLVVLMDLDSATFTKVEDSECDLEKAQTNAGNEISAKAIGSAALISFNLKNLKAGAEKSFDLQVTCNDNTTTMKLTTRKTDTSITSVETSALQRESLEGDVFDFSELSGNLSSVQSAYDKAFFTTGKNLKKYLSKMQADKLLSAGSKALVKLEKQKGKLEFVESNKQLSAQVKAAISQASKAINEVKTEARSALEDGKNRQAQFGTAETESVLSKAVELYSQGEYLESLNLAGQVTGLLPEASVGSQSAATGNVVANSNKDLTLYASIAIILAAIGYLVLSKKKEPDKPLTIIPSNNV